MPALRRTAAIDPSPQLASGLRAAVLPRQLTPPSHEECVGNMRTLSGPVLIRGEAVGPIQTLPTRSPRHPAP